MQFSMNGFRHQLSNDVKSLRDIVQQMRGDEYFDEEELYEAVNQVITHSNVVNCVYSNDDPLFTDMSSIQVEHLEIHEEANG